MRDARIAEEEAAVQAQEAAALQQMMRDARIAEEEAAVRRQAAEEALALKRQEEENILKAAQAQHRIAYTQASNILELMTQVVFLMIIWFCVSQCL